MLQEITGVAFAEVDQRRVRPRAHPRSASNVCLSGASVPKTGSAAPDRRAPRPPAPAAWWQQRGLCTWARSTSPLAYASAIGPLHPSVLGHEPPGAAPRGAAGGSATALTCLAACP